MDSEMGGDGQSKNHMRVRGASCVAQVVQPWVVKLDAASAESEVES